MTIRMVLKRPIGFAAGSLDLPMAVLAAVSVAFLFYAMPDYVFSRIISATGLPEIVSAAQPPLGGKARFAVGVVGAVGAFLGVTLLFMALENPPKARILRPKESPQLGVPRVRREDAHPDAPMRRPIFAGSEIGEPLFPTPEAADAILPDGIPDEDEWERAFAHFVPPEQPVQAVPEPKQEEAAPQPAVQPEPLEAEAAPSPEPVSEPVIEPVTEPVSESPAEPAREEEDSSVPAAKAKQPVLGGPIPAKRRSTVIGRPLPPRVIPASASPLVAKRPLPTQAPAASVVPEVQQSVPAPAPEPVAALQPSLSNLMQRLESGLSRHVEPPRGISAPATGERVADPIASQAAPSLEDRLRYAIRDLQSLSARGS